MTLGEPVVAFSAVEETITSLEDATGVSGVVLESFDGSLDGSAVVAASEGSALVDETSRFGTTDEEATLGSPELGAASVELLDSEDEARLGSLEEDSDSVGGRLLASLDATEDEDTSLELEAGSAGDEPVLLLLSGSTVVASELMINNSEAVWSAEAAELTGEVASVVI